MAIKLKDENILDQWSTVIDDAAGHAFEVLEDIQEHLEASRFPDGTSWKLEEVKSGGGMFGGGTKRELLFIRQKALSDYKMYVGVRDYGAHLDICRFLTCEPGRVKKFIAEKLAGYSEALSQPSDILNEQDLRAWVTVVHHCVVGATGALMKRLDQDPTTINRTSKGALEVW